MRAATVKKIRASGLAMAFAELGALVWEPVAAVVVDGLEEAAANY
jgi:hypothetical protein